ncbi:hypothetical protein BGW80DRAFT_1458713 [Lactifluus volemus]|nr:hypothetical protein BGW80DRAFT_1458713 [Lactifluus volemus]
MAENIALVNSFDFEYLYTASKQWLFWIFTLAGPASFLYNAPFGKFATPDSILSLDGIKSWILMELVSPFFFLFTAYLHPFSHAPLPTQPQSILTALYLLHYLNRALISPLRTPYRAKSHIVVVLSGMTFNALNGFLLAAFLTSSSSSTASFLIARPHTLFPDASVWASRSGPSAIAKGKAKQLHDDDDDEQQQDGSGGGQKRRARQVVVHYAIPHGGLYTFVSFPNYLCEWVEWFGFALAASPIPDFALLPSANALLAAAASAQVSEVARLLFPFVDSISPPWLFFILEVVTMTPRALRGHRWYHERFRDSYPRDRRAIVPWLL